MTVRLFVGCAANGEDIESQAVLEYSAKKHSSGPVDIMWMRLSRNPDSPFYSDGIKGWQTQLWSTPFSGFRWAVPLLAEEGKAIYCDSDVIFMADIYELYTQDMGDNLVLAKGGKDSWRFCVSLWDARAKDIIPSLASLQSNMMAHKNMIEKFKKNSRVGQFSGNWNVIDGEDFKYLTDPSIKVIHYSAEDCQPQLKWAVPRLGQQGKKHWFDGQMRPHWRTDLQELFDELLMEATNNGYPPGLYLPRDDFGPYQKASHAKGYRSHRWAK